MNTPVSRAGFLIVGPSVGFAAGVIGSLLFQQYYRQDLYVTILYGSLIMGVCVIAGIALPGYFYCVNVKQKKNFPRAVGFSILGLLLFGLLTIALFAIASLCKQSRVLAAFVPLISLAAVALPFVGAAVGFSKGVRRVKNAVQH